MTAGIGAPWSVAVAIVAAATRRGLALATAESLTGGALCSALVDVPGASRAVAGGAVCYSYAAKARLLGVDAARLEADGAVTAEVAEAMARGALELYGADLAVATTGTAGPGPDERGVPAGTVHLAFARRDSAGNVAVEREEHRFDGERQEVRAQSIDAGLRLLLRAIEGDDGQDRPGVR